MPLLGGGVHPIAYEPALYETVHEAWEEWRALLLTGRLLFPARSRACLVHDFIVRRAIAALAGEDSVRVLRRDETAKFIFGDTVALRFKKASDNGLGSNIRTQATLDFVQQQMVLPGVPNAHKVEVVYVLNALQTQIDEVLVTARDGDSRLWSYPITPARTADIITFPPAPVPEPGRGARITIRGAAGEEKNSLGET